MPINIPAGKYYGTQEAAAYLDYTDSRIRQWIRKGVIQATRIGDHSFIITVEEVERIKANPPKLGRPKSIRNN